MSEKISLGEHMMKTQEFVTKALQMTADMIPDLVAVQKIRRERMLKRLSEPNANEGAEDSTELDWNVTTDQCLGTSQIPIR